MAVESIKGAVEAAIQRASNATGVDFGFLLGAAKRESGYNPGAKAGTSSAAGLFQFVEQTWMSTLKKHGAKYGYARYADLIQQGADGRYHIDGSEARKAVMDLRFDPHAASLMAGELTSDHAAYLRGRVGRDPTAGELYAAHFLGPQGSAKLIEAVNANPNTPAAALFPDAAASNKTIFYRAGRATTVSELYANLTKAQNAGPVRASGAPAAAEPAQKNAFLQYASARRLDRMQQEEALVEMVLRGPQSPDLSGAGGGSRGGASGLAGSLFSADMLRVLSDARHGHKSDG
ncbi:MAG: transglycosylase SLT domain-containing protein [Caulobacteraceae bacterium]|nr:transglycosylase SLT domain-containing protein [Caulobacteraceae bacterium]